MESLIIMLAVIVHYYLGVDKQQAYLIYIIAELVFFVVKNICYFLHKEKPLPEEWYYKNFVYLHAPNFAYVGGLEVCIFMNL